MQERKENRAAEADDAASRKQLAAPMPVDDYNRIREIRERLAAATAGPWHLGTSGYSVRDSGENIIVNGACVPARAGEMVDTLEFIAEAREDVGWLLSIIDELSLAATCDGCGEPRAQGPCSRHCDNDA